MVAMTTLCQWLQIHLTGKCRRLLSVGAALLVGSSLACSLARHRGTDQTSYGAEIRNSLPEGYWQASDGSDFLLGVESSTILIAYGGRLREVMERLDSSSGAERVCRFGRDSTFMWSIEGPVLKLQDQQQQETYRLRRLPHKPESLNLDNFHIPEPLVLSEERTAKIRQELYLRQMREQDSLRSHSSNSGAGGQIALWLQNQTEDKPNSSDPINLRFATAAAENTEYVRSLLAEVGWIDVSRFGYPSSKSAFLLVQHSWEAPLLFAVLPWLKKDVDAGRVEGDVYALMYDRLQLSLGKRQRYGSQIGRDATGAPEVLPVQDPEHVDGWRTGLHLIPLKDYLGIFGASEVRFSQACRPR